MFSLFCVEKSVACLSYCMIRTPNRVIRCLARAIFLSAISCREMMSVTSKPSKSDLSISPSVISKRRDYLSIFG